MELPTINTLWVGGKLSYIEQVCLKSALDNGHKVVLYTYDGVENIPDGVIVRDGRKILPIDRILSHNKDGRQSFALGADIFRYHLMKYSVGIWIDADVYVNKPIRIESNYIFGFEAENYINGAVLYIPSTAKLLSELLRFVDAKICIPPWWSEKNKIIQKLLSPIVMNRPPEKLPWGVFGPKALTHFVYKLQLEKQAQSKEVFYPVHWKQANIFFDPNYNVGQFIKPETVTIHLWNEIIKAYKTDPPATGSFIDLICRKHGINY